MRARETLSHMDVTIQDPEIGLSGQPRKIKVVFLLWGTAEQADTN